MAFERRSFFEKLTGNEAHPKVEKEIAPDKGSEQDTTLETSEMQVQENAETDEGQLTLDVFQDDANVYIQSTIAGVRPEDIDVSITNDMVTIKGERKKDMQVRDEDYFYQECYWGAFSRSVILPVDVIADEAEANLKNGILTVKIPKAIKKVSKSIKVKAV